ncbi:MAG: AAA family ATPase [Granulosicoccaceae bacterium]
MPEQLPQLNTLAIANYRSILDLCLPLGRLNLITGANGSGKSNLYRALRLLVSSAQGNLVSALAAEGGLASTLWAGPEELSRSMLRGEQPVQGMPRKDAVRLKLGFASDDLGYAVELGLPVPGQTAFNLDPQFKHETLFSGPFPRPASILVSRDNAVVKVREGSKWRVIAKHVQGFDSMFTHALEPSLAPEMFVLRERVRDWRFYDHFRTDADAPARRSQLGTRTPVLSHDGADVAAAVRTIQEIGDPDALDHFVDDAFPGARLHIESKDGLFELRMEQPGMLRALRGSELSDGTLRYLCLIAALLSPRPPGLLVLNEPETSLHTDLLPALGGLIASAADRSQLIVVSHAPSLVRALSLQDDCNSLVLAKHLGATDVPELGMLSRPAWQWKS